MFYAAYVTTKFREPLSSSKERAESLANPSSPAIPCRLDRLNQRRRNSGGSLRFRKLLACFFFFVLRRNTPTDFDEIRQTFRQTRFGVRGDEEKKKIGRNLFILVSFRLNILFVRIILVIIFYESTYRGSYIQFNEFNIISRILSRIRYD